MARESESKLDFESWMNSVGVIFSTQLTGDQKFEFLSHVTRLCSATEIHEFWVGLPDLIPDLTPDLGHRDFIRLLPIELSYVLLSYFDVKTLFTACRVGLFIHSFRSFL